MNIKYIVIKPTKAKNTLTGESTYIKPTKIEIGIKEEEILYVLPLSANDKTIEKMKEDYTYKIDIFLNSTKYNKEDLYLLEEFTEEKEAEEYLKEINKFSNSILHFLFK